MEIKDLIPITFEKGVRKLEPSISINDNGIYLNKAFVEKQHYPVSGYFVIAKDPKKDDVFYLGNYAAASDIPPQLKTSAISYTQTNYDNTKGCITVRCVWAAKEYGKQSNVLNEVINLSGRAFIMCLPEKKPAEK